MKAWTRKAEVGRFSAVLAYRAADEADAPPEPQTPEALRVLKWARSARGKTMTKAARARRKADPEKAVGESEYQKARYARNNPRTVEQIDPILAALDAHQWRLTDILITHHHPDHIDGVDALRDRFGNDQLGRDGVRLGHRRFDRRGQLGGYGADAGETHDVAGLDAFAHLLGELVAYRPRKITPTD